MWPFKKQEPEVELENPFMLMMERDRREHEDKQTRWDENFKAYKEAALQADAEYEEQVALRLHTPVPTHIVENIYKHLKPLADRL